MDRVENLEQNEHAAREGERSAKAVAALDGADEHAHGDREHRGQHAAQDEHDPPRDRQKAVRLRQDAEENPFLSRGQLSDHGKSVSSTVGRLRLVRM